MASPETEMNAAYVSGRAAAVAGAVQTANPFSTSAGGIIALQGQSWLQGWIDSTKDLSTNLLNTLIQTQRKTTKFTLTNAQMLAIFTTPVAVLPALAGNVIVPYEVQARKFAGAYTIGTMSSLDLRIQGSGTSLGRVTALAGWLDQAAETSAFFFGPGGATMLPDLGAVNAVANLPLTVLGLTANPTGAGGAIELTLTYRYVPLVGLAAQ